MSRSKRAKSGASERQEFWLEHQQAQVASGQSAKAYAAAHDLSLPGFYAARKRLRAQGLLAPSGRAVRQRRSAKVSDISFARVSVARPRDPGFRLELPGGVVLTWSGEALPSSVIELLERMRVA